MSFTVFKLKSLTFTLTVQKKNSKLYIVFFLFQSKFDHQPSGTAMGSPLSSVVANIFMEAFEAVVFQIFEKNVNTLYLNNEAL